MKFEEYLQNKFMEDFHGSKDQCEDAFDGWLSNLDGQEYIDYAETYGKEQYIAGQGNILSQ